MTLVLTRPQQELEELVPMMTQIGGISSSNNRNLSNIPISTSPIWSMNSVKRRHRKKSSRFCPTISLVLFLVIMVTLPYLLTLFDRIVVSLRSRSTQIKHVVDDGGSDPKAPPSLVRGIVGEDSVSYYHQPAASPTEEHHHVVLLHGAAFSKEDWKTSGILGLFRKDFPSITVTALDLPVKAKHDVLERLLRSMLDEDLILRLPISALVTPSASGKSVTTWIKEKGSAGLSFSNYVSTWIPVASYSVANCTPQDLQKLQSQFGGGGGVSVLAIYGDKDSRGKTVSVSLQKHAGANALELPGSHSVYLDSPDAFVDAVGKKVLE